MFVCESIDGYWGQFLTVQQAGLFHKTLLPSPIFHELLMKEPITGVPLTHQCIITSQRPFSSLLPSNAGQISQLPNRESSIFIDISDSLYGQNICYKSTIIKWTLQERKEKNQAITVVEEQCRHAAINAHLHKRIKNAIGRLWEWHNRSVSNDLSWRVQLINLHWVLGDPTDLWKRRGVVPGHEGTGTLGRLLELGVDWTGPASHSCLVCEDPAAFAVVERGRDKERWN